MRAPRLLDLFCGAGGAGVGYHRAGFSVVGVDLLDQPDYPFVMVQGDALAYLRAYGETYDVIHASPPCQAHSITRHIWQNGERRDHPELVDPTRELLQALGRPWIIENVPGAPMAHSVMLCGSMFGLGIRAHGGRQLRRHRLFETSFPMLGPTCQHRGATIGIYGDHARDRQRNRRSRDRGRDFPDGERMDLAREALGMPWAQRWHGLSQAIPPAYTEYLGAALLDQLGHRAA